MHAPATAQGGAVAFFLFTTLIPPCANSLRFGPSYPVSKLLKFLKLLGQCLHTEIKSLRMIASWDAVTHTPIQYKSRCNATTVAETAVIVESKTLFRSTEQY